MLGGGMKPRGQSQNPGGRQKSPGAPPTPPPTAEKPGYAERLRILNLDSLEMRRLRADLAEVYKIAHGVDNRNFCDFFQLCNNNNRGHTFKL